MRTTLPSLSITLAGLMSRCARPASHICRITCNGIVDDLVVDLGIGQFLGVLEELTDHEVLAFGGDLDDPERLRARHAASRINRWM